MGIRKKIVKGNEYYYLEETLRLETPKVYSIFLGKKIPDEINLKRKRQELLDKIYGSLLGKQKFLYVTREQLIEVEKRKRRFAVKFKKLGKAKLDEKEEVDTVNFVYTTLTTEGVPITKEDAGLAYKFDQKNIKTIRDENLRVALDMIKGLRYVKESKKGITEDFILKLHQIIMDEYKEKNPGTFRKEQAYIYLKSYEKAEEIRFRPPTPDVLHNKLRELVEWYNTSLGNLNAIELAALLHLRFYMIHPFKDGNKRVSRLLFNKAFLDFGYPMLNISKDTDKYFDALISSVENKDEKPFVQFVFEQFIKYV
ncbi:MAG: Fic family protein [Candidatus Micrarchaeota archaeon]|nr:Fic family protein [Candidatus Micrarchaeota archaeon]